MPALRSIAKGLGGFIFITAFVMMIITLTLTSFTEYSNIKPVLSEIITSTITQQIEPGQNEAILSDFRSMCANTSVSTATKHFDNITITLSCADVNSASASDIPRLMAISIVDMFYYKDYGCSYIECLRSGALKEEAPFVLFASSMAHEFFSSINIYFLIVAIFGGIIMAWGAGSIPSALKAFGWSFLIIGVGYFFIGISKSLIHVPPEAQAVISALFDPLFAAIMRYFLYSLVAGIALLIAGYGFKFLSGKKETK
ncbi:MAG: hypothetical protein KQA33_02250 [Candidatus Aenigmarchaeota archaeon]|nr:hypothetical protein [Candidatus Aenigmarchaeota archaeon]